MGQISKQEASLVWEEFSKSSLSSVTFINQGTIAKFSPSSLTRYFLLVFYLFLLSIPHIVYFQWSFTTNSLGNTTLYFIFVGLGIGITLLLAISLPINEIIIDPIKGELEFVPNDFIGRYLKKRKQVKLSEINTIEDIRYSTKSSSEIYLTLVLKDSTSHRLFPINNWDNVTKLKAAFTALVFNTTITYDDSMEPSVILDNALEKLKNEKEGETSYLPFILLLFTLFVLVVGAIVYFTAGRIANYSAQVDSLFLVVTKYCGICLAVYSIPLFFASRTAYQIKKKATKKTVVVFGIMAATGFYLLCNGLVVFFNKKLDKSVPINCSAKVLDNYYTSGSKNSAGHYTLVIQLNGTPNKISVKHTDAELNNNENDSINVSVFNGYFGKRWLKIE